MYVEQQNEQLFASDETICGDGCALEEDEALTVTGGHSSRRVSVPPR